MRVLPIVCFCCAVAVAQAGAVQPDGGGALSDLMWGRLLAEAEQLDLPTAFLKTIPPGFIRFEFEDLRTYAAEYHPAQHRMILNRSLSFNAAGRTLRSLTKMTHKDLEVLYHELFHAYMDFLTVQHEPSAAGGDALGDLMVLARTQQRCRYGEVTITPIVQRKNQTESRYLTETESWEALNETWAVFIGWAIWNQLEVQRKGGGHLLQQERLADQWMHRLKAAFQNGELRGYYVPEDPDERRVTQKRFLAKQSQISWQETVALMKQVLGFPDKFIELAGIKAGLSGFIEASLACKNSIEQ